jgi:hypothetical protein
MKARLLAAAITALSSGAHALDGLPQLVNKSIQESRGTCQNFTTHTGFIVRRDINGDGLDDFVLDYGKTACDQSSSWFCGTGGCLIQVFASLGTNKYVKVLDQNAYEVRFERRAGRHAMIQLLHGVHCGRAGADGGCRLTTYWNGHNFSPAVPVR